MVELGLHALRQVALDVVQTAAEHTPRKTQERRRVLACLDDQAIRLTHHEQGSVRLDRTGEMDLLPLAVREIGLPECGYCGGRRHRARDVSRGQALWSAGVAGSRSRP